MSEVPKNNSPEKIAAPTIGRIVHIFGDPAIFGDKPCVGIVAGFYFNTPDDLFINAAVMRSDGSMVVGGLQGVPHISVRGDSAVWWDWMPYQKGQAAKTAELERQLQEVNPIATFDHGTDPTLTGMGKRVGAAADAGQNLRVASSDGFGKLQAGAPSPEDGKR